MVKQHGFSLLEIVITMLIIAIGILGVASIQIISLKNNQSAYYRSQANFLVSDMLDRMRANTAAFDTGAYDGIDSTGSLPTDPACSTSPAGCTTANIAIHDIREWMLNFPEHTSNPLIQSSKGTVTTSTSAGVGGTGDVTITITWDEVVNKTLKTQTVTVLGRI